MSYTPTPFPGGSFLTTKLRDWSTAQFAAISLAMPNELVIDAARFNLPIEKGTDATPAFEKMLKQIPDGALIVFSQPGTLDFKQEMAIEGRRCLTFASMWSARSGTDATRTTFRWSGASGGRAFFVRSCHTVGFRSIAFVGGGEDVLVDCDENGVNGVDGSRCFWENCTFLDPTNRPGHRHLWLSRTARANQEWHRAEQCDFSSSADVPFVGGRYGSTDAGNLTAGSDVLTINGPFSGPGNSSVSFSSRFHGSDLTAAVGPDGRTQFRATIQEILSPTSVRLSAPAPLDAPNCYFAITNARGFAISVGYSNNSLKHRFHRCNIERMATGIECVDGSFHSSECIYFANNRNIACVAAIEPCCDEQPTCENSLQHLWYWGDNGFQLEGPGRLALSTPMPAAPFISFGNGAVCTEFDHIGFQDRGPLPKGSTIFDPTRAYDWKNDPSGQPPQLQLTLRGNTYWYGRADLGLYQPMTGSQQIRREMEYDRDGLVNDQKIDANGATGA